MAFNTKTVRLVYLDSSGNRKDVKVESDDGVLHIYNWVYKTAILDWVKMEQPSFEFTGDLTVTMGDLEKLAARTYWLDRRIDDTSGNIDYVGLNIVHKASVDSATWYIKKYSDYNGGLARRTEGPLVGTWTGRAALAWA